MPETVGFAHHSIALAPVEALLRNVAGRAASPKERLGPAFVCLPTDPEVVAERLRRWRSLTSDGDDAAFVALLAAQGIDDPARAVSDAAVAHPAQLPAWAAGVRWLFSAEVGADERAALAAEVRRAVIGLMSGGVPVPPAGTTAPPRPSPNGLGSGLFVPFYVLARRHLEEVLAGLPSQLRFAVEPEAFEPLAAGLVSLLVRASVGLLRVASAGPGTPTWRERLLDAADPAAEWLALMERYPGLLRLFGCCAQDWKAASAELLHRLAKDLPALQRTLLDDRSPAPVVASIVPGRGDDHGGHRTVTLIAFRDGARVLYKPRSLAPMAALRTLTERLGGDAQAPPPLATPRVLLRDGYGFEEFVLARPPAGAAEHDGLARRAGAALRLLSALGSNDATAHNVVIRGCEIVLIDAETMLRCRLPGSFDAASPDAAEPLVATAFVTSVSEPSRVGATFDHGVLAPAELSVVAQRADIVREGFAAGHDRLTEGASRLDHLLAEWQQLPVRTLLRGTWVYARLLEESLRPQPLRDGFERELALARLWQAGRAATVDERVLDAEAAALRDGDIPLFWARAGQRQVRTADGTVVGELAAAPLDDARERVRALPRSAPVEQLDAVDSLLFAAHPGAAPAVAVGGHERAVDADPLEDALRIARGLADRITGAGAVRALLRLPHNGAFVLDPLADDVLSGAAGLSVVFRFLARQTGDDQLAAAADGTLRRVEVALGRELDALATWQRPGGRVPLPGAHCGIGGLMLAIADAREEATAGLLEDAVARIAAATLPPNWGTDVGLGVPGLIAAVRHPHTPQAADLERRLAAYVTTGAAPPPLQWALLGAEENAPPALTDRPSLALLLAIERGLCTPGRAAVHVAPYVAALLARRHRDGRWFGERLAADRYRISAVWGTAAVAYALARFAVGAPGRSLWFPPELSSG